MADHLAEVLRERGLTETAGEGLVPPRLRAFTVPGVELADLRASLGESAVRAWTGRAANGVTLLRISMHIYNDTADAAPLVRVLRDVWDR